MQIIVTIDADNSQSCKLAQTFYLPEYFAIKSNPQTVPWMKISGPINFNRSSLILVTYAHVYFYPL